MRTAPCLRIGTSTLPFFPGRSAWLCERSYLVSQEALGLFDTALEVADRIHLAEIHADSYQSLGNLRRQARDNDRCAEQPGGFDRLHQVVCDGNVHRGHAGDVNDYDLCSIGANSTQQLFSQLAGAL